MTTSAVDSFDASIFSRAIAGETANLPMPVAEEVLKWEFAAADRVRMSDLAGKARQGSLTAEERDEADSYERVSSFLGILKSKARRSIRVSPGASH